MALFFITEHVGIIIGYGLAYTLVKDWYWGFLAQAIMMGIAGIMFMTITNRYFDQSVFKLAEAEKKTDIIN